MKAIGVTEFGGPEALQLVQLPVPEPGPHEVRIRVRNAAVNPSDLDFRVGEGLARELRDRRPPFVPGLDAAGVIEKLGPDADDRLAVGDHVIALVLPTGPHGGAYAEQIVVPAASVVPAPTSARFPAAATLLLNGLTARLSLDALSLTAGQTVAVTGAAGALGGYAMELAKADGLQVVGDAGPADEPLVESLGADLVVPRGDDVASAIRDVVPDGVDGLIDAAAQEALVVPAIKDGGGLAVIRGWDGPTERGIVLHKISGPSAATDTRRLERLAKLAEDGTLTLRVAEVLPAEQAARAHRLLEARGIRGRLVLDFTS